MLCFLFMSGFGFLQSTFLWSQLIVLWQQRKTDWSSPLTCRAPSRLRSWAWRRALPQWVNIPCTIPSSYMYHLINFSKLEFLPRNAQLLRSPWFTRPPVRAEPLFQTRYQSSLMPRSTCSPRLHLRMRSDHCPYIVLMFRAEWNNSQLIKPQTHNALSICLYIWHFQYSSDTQLKMGKIFLISESHGYTFTASRLSVFM